MHELFNTTTNTFIEKGNKMKHNNQIKKTIIVIGKGLSLFIILCLMISQITYAKDYPQKFWDVPKEHWAFTYIADLAERGVINGYADGSFKPSRTVSRAEWAKIMVDAAGVATNDNSVYYTDTAEHWANKYVNAAKKYLTGYTDGSYRPDQSATREDVTVAMVRIKGYDLSEVDYSYLSGFSDVDSISNYAKGYVAVAVQKKLISGFDDGTFKGQATLTRAEAATLLYRAFQYGNADKIVAVPELAINPTLTVKEEPKIKENNAYHFEFDNEEKKTETLKEDINEDIVAEEVEEMKPFSLDTLVKNISDVSGMIAADDKLVVVSGDEVKIVGFDGDVEKLCDLPKFKNEIIKDYKLVYNQFKDEIYMVGQILNANGYPTYDAAVYILHDGKAELLHTDENIFLNIMYAVPIFIDEETMVISRNNMDGGGLIFWDGEFTESEDKIWSFGLMFYKNKLYSICEKEISEYSFSLDYFEKIADTDLPNAGEYKSYWTNRNILAIGDTFYFNDDSKIYTVDLKGNGGLYFNDDELDVLDRKPLKTVNYLSPIDGGVTFYDPDSNSIRIITENE